MTSLARNKNIWKHFKGVDHWKIHAVLQQRYKFLNFKFNITTYDLDNIQIWLKMSESISTTSKEFFYARVIQIFGILLSEWGKNDKIISGRELKISRTNRT